MSLDVHRNLTRQGAMWRAGNYTPAPSIASENDSAHTATAAGPKYDTRILPFGNTAWVVCEVIHLTCVTIALYLLYALLHYRAIRGKQPKTKASRYRKGGVWLENLCLIGILFALVRFAINQSLLFTGWVSGSNCSMILNVSIAMYFVAIHPVYLFLWIRQRIFYSNRALKHLFNRSVRFLSWAALVCFIVTTVVSMVLFVVDPENSASGRVCRWSLASTQQNTGGLANETTADWDGLHQGVRVNTIAGLLGGGIQTSFLALFLYPIMDSKLRAVRTRHLRSGNVGLLALIRRSFLLAGMCILSDVTIVLLVKKINTTYPEAAFAPLAMYDLNLIINLICIIITFRRWRVMLFPWLYCDACSALFSWMGSGTRQGQLELPRTGQKSPKDAEPHLPMSSVDICTNIDKSAVSSASAFKKTKKPVRASIPDMLAPILESRCAPGEPETWNTKSLLADLNQNVDSDFQPHSDSVLQVNNEMRQKHRSSSLVISRTEVLSFKQSNAKASASLLAQTKLWILESKNL